MLSPRAIFVGRRAAGHGYIVPEDTFYLGFAKVASQSQVGRLDNIRGREDHRPFHRIAKLPQVARPAVRRDDLLAARRESQVMAALPRSKKCK